ncbi:hypothetical protein WMY93_012321 [Mugilogobius chulae]|uniref:BEN domain-containing protein n=1 Tax=Mugilogobius chulae TaxID=88201 RepID=A0AAW0P6C0_9GOBI
MPPKRDAGPLSTSPPVKMIKIGTDGQEYGCDPDESRYRLTEEGAYPPYVNSENEHVFDEDNITSTGLRTDTISLLMKIEQLQAQLKYERRCRILAERELRELKVRRELFLPCGEYRVPRNLYERIAEIEDYKKYTGALLMMLFDRDTLATHSLQGRRGTLSGSDDSQKPQLPPDILINIIEHISSKFGVDHGLIKTAIRTKLNNEDKLFKKRHGLGKSENKIAPVYCPEILTKSEPKLEPKFETKIEPKLEPSCLPLLPDRVVNNGGDLQQ